jgi:ribosomal-protein-alanine N-acetyltransferase
MVAATLRRRPQGLVPFDPFRHLRQVADLIAETFASEMGPGTRDTLRRMQQTARWGALSLWLWEVESGAFGAPGFVWLEDGRVVGNVSLRRAASPGGWIIGNVAVNPDWQGQGIGRALVEAAVRTTRQRGGVWVGLEVRDDNAVAVGLYERMGFETVGSTLELARPPGTTRRRSGGATITLRRARAADGETLYRLAQEGLSGPHQEVLEIRRSAFRAGWEAQLAGWLEGYSEGWWIAEAAGRAFGALHVRSRRSVRWHHLEVLAREDRLDEAGPELAAAGLDRLARRPPWETTTTLPGPLARLEPTFAAAGFRRVRRLVQMRLTLGRRPRIAR